MGKNGIGHSAYRRIRKSECGSRKKAKPMEAGNKLTKKISLFNVRRSTLSPCPKLHHSEFRLPTSEFQFLSSVFGPMHSTLFCMPYASSFRIPISVICPLTPVTSLPSALCYLLPHSPSHFRIPTSAFRFSHSIIPAKYFCPSIAAPFKEESVSNR